MIQNGRVSLPVRNPYTGEVDYEITPPAPEELARICAGLTLFKTRDVGTNSFGDSALGGDRTGPGSILRFLRKKALMTQSAPPAPLVRPSVPARPA